MREATGEIFKLYRLEFEGRKAAEAETARLRAALLEIRMEPDIWRAQGIAEASLAGEDKKEGL